MSIGIGGSIRTVDGREHMNGAGQQVPCPVEGGPYYLSEDGHLWIAVWTRNIDLRIAETLLPEWRGSYPKGGGA